MLRRLWQGVHAKFVQEGLGHFQCAVTVDTYSNVLPLMQQGAADKLDALLSQGRREQGPARGSIFGRPLFLCGVQRSARPDRQDGCQSKTPPETSPSLEC